jgi:mannitol/fructose-specific phosphotransferase system IIA component (Ntr-type)
MNLGLGDILGPEQIITDLKAADRWQAIDELVDKLVSTGKVKSENRDAVAAAVKERERKMSTGIGFGIGIPHGSTDLISEVVAAFGRSAKGADFEALDSQPVTLVTLFLVPRGQFQAHLHTLASIAKLFKRNEFRRTLEEAPDAATMYEIIQKESASK